MARRSLLQVMRGVALGLLCLWGAAAEAQVIETGEWEELAPGLALREDRLIESEQTALVALRIDPELCELRLYSAALDEKIPQTIHQWATEYGLNALINASMFLPDGLTSTAYMRIDERVGNGHIAEKYGSFFASQPRKSGLAGAVLLDRDSDDWPSLLPEYGQVVQNFRLFGPDNVQNWPENGAKHSIAAVGMNEAGELFFLHYEPPVSVHEFVRILREESGLGLTRAMYVEGGSEAVLGVWTDKRTLFRLGHHPANFFFGGPVLPNILGLRLRSE